MLNGLIIDKHGTKYWYLNNYYHNINGPAIEYADGAKYWYSKGLLHRENGPAVEYADGTKHWYIEGKEVTKELHAKLVNIKSFW